MKALYQWQWVRQFMPNHVARERNVHVKVFDVEVAEGSRGKFPDPTKLPYSDTCFITGDAKRLAEDVAEFNSWGLPHDIMAVNRSLIFHQRPVRHWVAVDVEEACWFTQHTNDKIDPDHDIVRHSIGEETKEGNTGFPGMFDCFWEIKYPWENELQRTVFIGNSGYFAVLIALKMGYSKIVLGGMPMDLSPHFYETDDTMGPHWTGMTFMQWMDFKTKVSEAERVRSMSGYSAFILGQADKEWAVGG